MFPTGPLLASLAERILANLEAIEKVAPKWGSLDQDRPPYADTQLLISLLGVLVFPHERTPGALGTLLRGYKPLEDVLTVRYSRSGLRKIEITDPNGEAVLIDPSKLTKLPVLLRNSIAHFNMLPLDVDGRFAGVRVWNRDNNDVITFVADIHFDPMRKLARHVLEAMRDRPIDVGLEDPQDPMIEVEAQRDNLPQPRTPRKPPRLNSDIWDHLVNAHDGNYQAAKEALDRLMKREADRLSATRSDARSRWPT